MIWGLLFNSIVLASGIFAFLAGEKPERTGAALLIGATALSWVAFRLSHMHYSAAEIGVFAVDCALLLGLCILALRADRYWPIFAAGFQGVGVLTHLAMLTGTAIAPLAYAHALNIWSYLVILSLVLGTAAVRRRQSRIS
jgi:hypothetical protein